MVSLKISIFKDLPIRLKVDLRDFTESKRITYYYHFKDKKLDDLNLDEIKRLVNLATALDIKSLDDHLFQ